MANRSIEKWFFIDQTLTQLFRDYGTNVGDLARREAIAMEREGYASAALVVVNSRWAAQSVIDDYGISPRKVAIVLQGANFDEAAYGDWELNCFRRITDRKATSSLRLVFVGRDWRRKGLDRLLRAIRIMKRRGSRTKLRVIGCSQSVLPSDLHGVPDVEWIGLLNKGSALPKFLKLVSESDLGCLLSRAEAGGISIREFHALGLPVLGPDVGGAVDQMLPGASLRVSPAATPDDIAEMLMEIERSSERLASMTDIALRNRRSALWESSLDNLETLRQTR
jgi:glycosyltransferase involved in cell wall biosynthesis